MSTYDFSTLYTTLPHNLIKDKLIDLTNRTFIWKNTQYLACNKNVFCFCFFFLFCFLFFFFCFFVFLFFLFFFFVLFFFCFVFFCCCFFTSDVNNNHNLWSRQKVYNALFYLLDNIFIRFGTKLYRQTIGIPMGTNCAPLVADLFLFCYERDYTKSLSREN